MLCKAHPSSTPRSHTHPDPSLPHEHQSRGDVSSSTGMSCVCYLQTVTEPPNHPPGTCLPCTMSRAG